MPELNKGVLDRKTTNQHITSITKPLPDNGRVVPLDSNGAVNEIRSPDAKGAPPPTTAEKNAEIKLDPKILASQNKTLGGNHFNRRDGTIEPMHRWANADLNHASTHAKAGQAQELTRMVNEFHNNRDDSKLEDSGSAAAIFDYMEEHFSNEIPEERRIDILTAALSFRMPKVVTEATAIGNNIVDNPNLPNNLIMEKKEKSKTIAMESVYADLFNDVEDMKFISDNLEGVTGAQADVEMGIVSVGTELSGAISGLKNFVSNELSQNLSFLDNLWSEGTRDSSVLFDEDSGKARSFSVALTERSGATKANIRRFNMAKEKAKVNLKRIDADEREELSRASTGANRMSILQKYRLQKLFEFKKVALTYRLSSMLQGDGLGGGRTISNADYEVALKALWGPQKGLKLKLEAFLRTIKAKRRGIHYKKMSIDGDPRLATLGFNISGKYRLWHNRSALKSELFKKDDKHDLLNYTPALSNISLFSKNVYSAGTTSNDKEVREKAYNNFVAPIEKLKREYETNGVLINKTANLKYTSLREMKDAVWERDIRTNTMRMRPDAEETKFLNNIATLARNFTEQYMLALVKRVEPEKERLVLKGLNSSDMKERDKTYTHYFPHTPRSKIIGDVSNYIFQYYIMDMNDNEGED